MPRFLFLAQIFHFGTFVVIVCYYYYCGCCYYYYNLALAGSASPYAGKCC